MSQDQTLRQIFMKPVYIYSIKVAVVIIFVLLSIYFFFLPPRVVGVSLSNQGKRVDLNSSLVIEFDKPVERKALKHFISPNAYGEWKFENPVIKNHLYRVLIFKPAVNFEKDTYYKVKLKGITSPLGFKFSNNFYFTFKTISENKVSKEKIVEKKAIKVKKKKIAKIVKLTRKKVINDPQKPSFLPKPKITLINVAPNWQKHKLSCEAASLKMALASKGVFVSEEEIMRKIGFDKTPHRNGIWGDPYKSFVGNIDGKMCYSGYGVYWPAVARAANSWRPAEARSNWKLKDLTKEIVLGNPVVVWGSLPVRTLHNCSWHTPEGKYIKAIREDHVRLVVGFIGPAKNPSKIILNDPLSGRIYWNTSYFLTNWKSFNYSGVVIR